MATRVTTTTRLGLRRALRFALDAVLPPLCPACGRPLTDDGAVCATCWSRLSFIARPYCERLGIPFAHDGGPGLLSPRAIADPPAFGRARAAVRYDDVAGSLVHALKYGDRLELAPMMGRWMAEAGRELIAAADALVPVPLHWRRLWARRFNQAAALATVMADLRGIPVLPDAMTRVRATPQQVGLSRKERAGNVQSAFRVTEPGRGAVRGRRLIVVDDVMTTGATVESCARTLLRAGAVSVDVIVFACVVDATVV
ncbi:ComF family protein [Rhodoplanes sp. TEM]|uniref:ComF family protein n=1 Tax=Rhodoplanes tepidamans TaxID=200616 RepID=A0ABT5J4J9_RHOTP|nr:MULTISPECIES: ComF family protein [Rhodoplanes]MDC7784541.1 ComF family protein [Rhodoplanes tepidamans]MDC7984448.1 ComF family protein [Rhodoplanes sp. TEM]MDQ0355769.1 ComF family protein [Rhodoplanes tepidamans]